MQQAGASLQGIRTEQDTPRCGVYAVEDTPGSRGRKSPRYLASRWQEPSRVVTAWALPHLVLGVGRLRNDDPDGLETETGIRASTGVPGHLQHGFQLDNHVPFQAA